MVDEKSATLPSSMRRMRLRQLKKILPSDHISIEKNFPRFHQKCQTLKMNRIKSTADINDIDDVQDLRLNTTIGSDQPTLTNQFERVPSSDIHHIKAYKQYMVDSSEITMADHLEEMTLQRGCWLQATLRNKDNSSTSNNNNNNNNRKTLPAIVYTHRKRNDQQTGRVQLTMEVMEEFRRQKMHLLLQQYSSNDSINNNNTFTRSSYHNTLPIFNRASIHLHTRRVT